MKSENAPYYFFNVQTILILAFNLHPAYDINIQLSLLSKHSSFWEEKKEEKKKTILQYDNI